MSVDVVKVETRLLAEKLVRHGLGLHGALSYFEAEFLRAALMADRANQCRVARRLGVHRNTLQRRLQSSGVAIMRRGKKPLVSTGE